MSDGITRARLAELEEIEKKYKGANKAPEAKKEAEKSILVNDIDLKSEADKHKPDFEEEEEVLKCGSCGAVTKSRDKCDNCGIDFE